MKLFAREDLVTAYQLVAMVERPNRLKKLMRACFGSKDTDEAVAHYARSALAQSLSNAGIREGRDAAPVFEKIYALLGAIERHAGLRITQAEKTKLVKSISLDRYSLVLRITNALNRPNAPTEQGSFELSELLSGVLNLMVARQTYLGDAPASILPLIEGTKSKGAEYFKRGYPYDLLVHDCVAVATRHTERAIIYMKSDYLSTHIAFEGDEATAQFCRQNEYSATYQIAA